MKEASAAASGKDWFGSRARKEKKAAQLMDDAIRTPGLAVGICSASTRGGFEKVVDAIVGQERLARLDVVIAGDDVSNKKPDPEIYNVAAQRLGMAKDECASAAGASAEGATRDAGNAPNSKGSRRSSTNASSSSVFGVCAYA